MDWLTDPDEPTHTGGALPPYLFRYMGSDGLLHTVRDRKLRMNAWSQMNDPREAKEWRSSGTLAAIGSYSDAAMREHLDAIVRRSARLMSLTEDRPPASPTARPYLFHRGWARAALWSHYAQAHAGVCLVLDEIELMRVVRDAPAVDGRYTTWGRVRYLDEPILIDISGRFADEPSLDQAIEDHLDARGSIAGLHMIKNTDWSYEAEVRLATIDLRAKSSDLDTPLYLDLGRCLVGVIVGDAHSAPSIVADGIRADMGADAPEMFQCRWVDGAPHLSSVTAAAP